MKYLYLEAAKRVFDGYDGGFSCLTVYFIYKPIPSYWEEDYHVEIYKELFKPYERSSGAIWFNDGETKEDNELQRTLMLLFMQEIYNELA